MSASRGLSSHPHTIPILAALGVAAVLAILAPTIQAMAASQDPPNATSGEYTGLCIIDPSNTSTCDNSTIPHPSPASKGEDSGEREPRNTRVIVAAGLVAAAIGLLALKAVRGYRGGQYNAETQTDTSGIA